MRILVYVIVFFVLDLSYAEIYLAYTNNSGTYTSRQPASSYEKIALQSVQVSQYGKIKNDETTDKTNLQVETAQNKSSVVSVPVSINDNNVNNYLGLKSLYNEQRRGYIYQGNKCTTCDEDDSTQNVYPPLEKAFDSTEDVDDQTDCCYISEPRSCIEENGVHTCRTKVTEICGNRCYNPENGKEAYFKTELENPRSFAQPKKKATHPYAKVPPSARVYPGKRYPTSFESSRPRHRPNEPGYRPAVRYPWNYENGNVDQSTYYGDSYKPNLYHDDFQPSRPFERPPSRFHHRFPGRKVPYRNPRPQQALYRKPRRNNFHMNSDLNSYYGNDRYYQDYTNHYYRPRRNRQKYNIASYAPKYSYQDEGFDYYK